MKFSNQGGGQFLNDIPTRPFEFDYNQTVIPHALTTRIAANPAGTDIWILTGIALSIKQQTAATVNAYSEIQVTLDVLGIGQLRIARLHLWEGIQLTQKSLFLPVHHRMINTTILRALTSDANTGGWIEYDITVSGYEVDG